MSVAVRYFSRSGHTRALAEKIAEEAGTTAISVDSKNAVIDEPTDVLFIGAAIYMYGLDKHMKAFLNSLDAGKVKKAYVFSTSMLSKHGLELLRKALAAKGIDVGRDCFYTKGNPDDEALKKVAAFTKKVMKN